MNKRSRRIIPYLLGLLFLVGTVIYMLTGKPASPHMVSPLPDEVAPNILTRLFGKKKDMNVLRTRLMQTIGTSEPNYSIFVYDIKNSASLGINETALHTGASVNKLPILAVLYYLAQKGTIDLDSIVTIQKDDIQDYGTGTIRYQEPGIQYSIKTLATLMMKQSDNTAAYILANHTIGMSMLQTILNGWGLTQIDMANNKISANDLFLLMKKMYEERVANHALTLDMFSAMKDTDFEDRIPAKLPAGTTVYHKIGTGVGVVHDIGIVVSPTTTYFVAFLFSNVKNEQETTARIADLSKTIYDFLK